MTGVQTCALPISPGPVTLYHFNWATVLLGELGCWRVNPWPPGSGAVAGQDGECLSGSSVELSLRSRLMASQASDWGSVSAAEIDVSFFLLQGFKACHEEPQWPLVMVSRVRPGERCSEHRQWMWGDGAGVGGSQLEPSSVGGSGGWCRSSPRSAGGVSNVGRVQPPGLRVDLTQGEIGRAHV